MFQLADVVGLVLQANRTRVPTIGELDTEVVGSCLNGLDLYASAFNAVTAAFATVGYYVHADLLEYVQGPFMKWATLIYLLAAFGGLAAMALGQPPRNYLWFFIGPAAFHWLIGTTVQTHGVAWMIGNELQDQTQVWKHAEIGVSQSNYWKRQNAAAAGGAVTFTIQSGPEVPAVVALPMVWLDSLISDTVQQFSKIIGVDNQGYQNGIGFGAGNLVLEEPGDLMHPNGTAIPPICGSTPRPPSYAVLSGLKWTFLHSIASAKLSNPHARDAFARFMSNECGDAFNEAVSPELFTSASHTKGESIPHTVMKSAYNYTSGNPALKPLSSRYNELKFQLAAEFVPLPRSLRSLLSDVNKIDGGGVNYTGWLESVDWGNANADSLKAVLRSDRIRCDTYLDLLIYYFRHQAGEIFVQSFENSNPQVGWRSFHSVYGMLYGWNIPPRSSTIPISKWDIERFVSDLILVHLVRNEMALVPKAYTPKHSGAQLVSLHAESFNRTVGSVSKFAEVYTWAMMMPYVQGIVIYLLALAYPLACLFVVIPGWHKIIITWMSFWVWVKLWDLGFSIVTSMERSIWAMLGNSDDAAAVNERVMDMQDYGAAAWTDCLSNDWWTKSEPCLKPIIQLTAGSVTAGVDPSTLGSSPLNVTDPVAYDTNLALFDTALTIGANLDYDLANGYYIYIMAALYFAVPAVTGQLVLGAKAGAAGMVDRIASDPAQKGGSGAQSGFTGAKTQQLLQNRGTIGQASMAKSYRSSGLAHQALGQQNASAEQGLLSSHLGQVQQGQGRLGNAAALTAQNAQRQFALGQSIYQAAIGGGASRKQQQLGEQGSHATGTDRTGAAATGTGGEGGGQPRGLGTDGGGGFSPNNALAMNAAANRWAGGSYGSQINAHKLPGGGAIDKMMKMGGKAGAMFNRSNFEGAMGIAGAAHSAATSERAAFQENQANAAGGAAGIASHVAGQASSGYRQAADRTGAAANFEAQSARYDALLGMASQLSSEATIAGYAAGGLDPGPRPDDMTGMAMKGMLDTNKHNTKDRANFFNPNGGMFSQMVAQSGKDLDRNYGFGATASAFQASSWSQEMGRAFGYAGSQVGRGFGGQGFNGLQYAQNQANQGNPSRWRP